MFSDYTNKHIVRAKARELFGDDVVVKRSTRASKKYMIYNPAEDKWIHFGQMGYEDFTKHKDEKKKKAFQARNARWAKGDKWSAGYLSYHLLW